MKKGILILLAMFMMVSTVEAENGNLLPNSYRVNYSYDNSVNFTERGIEFFVFLNGEFDFNTHYNESYYDYNGRRFSTNGVRIDRDYRGRVRRVGNVFINYDIYGNVTRIGSVFLRYYRGNLTNVGNLKVVYNRRGYPTFYGNVKNEYYYYNGVNINLSLGTVCNYNDAYFYRNDFRRNYTKFREDSRYFYYKANRNAKIGNRNKILKRRKPVSINRNKTYNKRKNISYRKSNATRTLDTHRKRNATSTSRRRASKNTVGNITNSNVRRSSTVVPNRRGTTVLPNRKTVHKNSRRVSETRKKVKPKTKIATRIQRKIADKKRENNNSTTRRRSTNRN
ncbi:hypothetical protein JL193_16850 [Polaribacter batillariae]|uniref:Uncharacterized protein n=1 Tax=Polaribacter batillariae TaxID=2808900 RepID=A0ABX7STW8_9FLAO|nr:hypothetical protein [Polaribacter batillariae]QTD37705.1 hypothetical protein JL193_16850 [Polaribacter batillariae]